jgi:hypothetical protein
MENEMTNIITHEMLKSWDACEDGYNRFCELFPNGADLKTAIDGLVNDGHDSWGYWLFNKCRDNNLFNDLIALGYRNTGDWNTGDCNTGYRNTGDCNTGYRNTGGWNTGDCNTGFFNTITPDTILIFNKECSLRVWEEAKKPNFLYFNVTYWVDESNMTDDDKIADPNFHIRGGQLRKRDYKEAFKLSWDNADKVNRELVRQLPNFDASIFFEISGIDLR